MGGLLLFVLAVLSLSASADVDNTSVKPPPAPRRVATSWACERVDDGWYTVRLARQNRSLECVANATASSCLVGDSSDECPAPTGYMYDCTNATSGGPSHTCAFLHATLIIGHDVRLRTTMLFFYYLGLSWGVRIVVALAMMLLGGASASHGYTLLRLLLIFYAGVAFSIAFYPLLETISNDATKIVVWIIAAGFCALLCATFYGLALAMTGGAAFAMLTLAIFDFAGLSSHTLAYLVVCGVALVGIVVALRRPRPLMICCSAYLGSTVFVYGSFFLAAAMSNTSKTIYDADAIDVQYAPYFVIAVSLVAVVVQVKLTALDFQHGDIFEGTEMNRFMRWLAWPRTVQ
ncbi:hypothetical protein ACHHYP_14710 [Achlya hypogyna]|uniref:TM7S3/TM198-like domain-containing protein n=1 Tax=Achlya hypogyna TaxID=1202772 RepID=A0A1V9YCM4_ACHHY|nr:hypothetical protein ACHHYP_14710 [Achlya hypogyna]